MLEERTNKNPSSLILCDLDGTLTKSVCWNKEQMLHAEPNIEMVNWINEKYAQCHVVIVFTARHESFRQETNYWLKKHGVKFHALRMGKIPCSLQVDDLSIKPDELLLLEKAKKIVSYPSKRWEVL